MADPLVIGGTGGSGTRVVARIARLGGRYMGNELNRSEDAMPFARFDWSWGRGYLESGPTGAMRDAFEQTLAEHLRAHAGGPWGWKHPHSYLFLPMLSERFPDMLFVHVVRDGRDVALSRNQQQARHYGSLAVGRDVDGPVGSAAWWAWANQRARSLGERLLGDRYLLLRFEDLCARPREVVPGLARFAELEKHDLAGQVEAPGSLARWRSGDPGEVARIEAACGAGLELFGYELCRAGGGDDERG